MAQEPAISIQKKWPTRTFTERDVQFDLNYTPIDTNSNRLELYSPLHRKVVTSNLGNVGLPAQSMIFNNDRQVGFNYGFNPLDIYFIKPQNTQYINTKAPFTDIFYTQGGPELLLLNLKHSQNINPRWNAGIELNRITCQGDLLRQKSSFYGVNAFTSYYSKQKHYVLLGNLTWNNGTNQESGGIASDSAYESLTGSLRQVYSNLSQCSTIYHSRGAYLKQFYRFGTSDKFITDKDTTYDFIPTSQIVLTTHIQEFSSAFYNGGDTSSTLLPHQYYDITNNTYDSIYTGKISNQLQYQLFTKTGGTRLFGVYDSVRTIRSLSGRFDLNNVAQPAFVRNFHNAVIEGSMEQISLLDGKTNLLIKGSYVVEGYNYSDYKFEYQQRIKLKKLSVFLGAIAQQYKPDFFNQMYLSNAFIWRQSLKETQYNQLHIGVKTSNLTLTYRLQHMDNYVYMNKEALPEQAKDNVIIHSIELNKTFKLWKFKFEHLIIYQYSDKSYIRLPEISGIARYYFQSRFFGFGNFQLGFNVFYNSAYYGYAYNPMQRQFYLQDDVKIGNYPVFSPYFIGDLKRASLFFVYEHLNQDWLSGTGYYGAAHYPIPLKALRMGVRWRLYE